MASKAPLYLKMTASFLALSLGGPALIYYVTPSEDEIRSRYNPELRARALAAKANGERDREFAEYVGKLKEWGRDGRPIWDAAADDRARYKAEREGRGEREREEEDRRRADMRREQLGR